MIIYVSTQIVLLIFLSLHVSFDSTDASDEDDNI